MPAPALYLRRSPRYALGSHEDLAERNKFRRRQLDFCKSRARPSPAKLKDHAMARRITADEAHKMNLMLSHAITAMRVNERLICRLLQWAVAHSQDPHAFIESVLEAARSDIRRSGDDGSTNSAIATGEALEYLDDLANEMKPRLSKPNCP